MKTTILISTSAASGMPDFFQIKPGHLVEEFGGFVESKSTMV